MATNKRKVETDEQVEADAAKIPKLNSPEAESKYFPTSNVVDLCNCMNTFFDIGNLMDLKNFRIKTGFASALEALVENIGPLDIYHYLCPIALQLVVDPVADVREAALHLINRQLMCLNTIEAWAEEEYLFEPFSKRLIDILCYGQKWVQRQSFAILSGYIINSESLGPNTFAQYFLSHLVSLCTDKVPNVRIRVAQALSFCRNREYYANPTDPYNSILADAITKLQNDSDDDVKYMIMMKDKPEKDKFENETELPEKENVNKTTEPVSSAPTTSEIDKPPPTKDEEIKRINDDSGIEEVGPSPAIEKLPEREVVNETTEPVSSALTSEIDKQSTKDEEIKRINDSGIEEVGPSPTVEKMPESEKQKIGMSCPQCTLFVPKWNEKRNLTTNCSVCNFRMPWDK